MPEPTASRACWMVWSEQVQEVQYARSAESGVLGSKARPGIGRRRVAAALAAVAAPGPVEPRPAPVEPRPAPVEPAGVGPVTDTQAAAGPRLAAAQPASGSACAGRGASASTPGPA